MILEAWGWNAQWQRGFAAHRADGLLPGRVIGEHRTHYQVATDAGELTAAAPGRVRNAAQYRSDLPGVGDFVALRLSAGDGPATVEAVLPRTSAFIRKASGKTSPQLIAANVDFIFIVMGLDGDFNLQRVERYLTLVRESGAAPVIVINKADIPHDAKETVDQIARIAPGVPMHLTSARKRIGVSDLEQYFDENRTVALVGSSGAGKSTLTNELLGHAAQATGEVRGHDSRGRHTTTHRQLFIRLRGGAILDTPGMRGLELWNPANEVIAQDFDDIEALAAECKFRDCRHDKEPGCAVRAAIARGDIDEERLESFSKLSAR